MTYKPDLTDPENLAGSVYFELRRLCFLAQEAGDSLAHNGRIVDNLAAIGFALTHINQQYANYLALPRGRKETVDGPQA